MKKSGLLFVLFMAIISCNTNAQNPLKRYEIQSGIIHYKSSTSGSVMGSTISGSGTESLYFKDWGAVELKEEESSEASEIKIFGKKKTTATSKHSLIKLDKGVQYIVDFDRSKITLGQNAAMDILAQTDTDVQEAGKGTLEAMGAKKIGNENYRSYNCEIWELMGTKQWIYKGISLKTEANIMGIKTIKEATSIEFNVSVPEKYFALPDFPIEQMGEPMNFSEFQQEDEEMNKSMEQMQNLSFEEWKKMVFEGDPEMKNTSEEELRQSYDMMQKMLKMRKGK